MSFKNSIWNSLSELRANLDLVAFRNMVLASLYLKYEDSSNYDKILEMPNNEVYSAFISSLDSTPKLGQNSTIIDDLELRTISIEGHVFKEVLVQLNKFVKEQSDYSKLFDTLVTLFSRSMGKAAYGSLTPQSIRSIFNHIVGDINSIIDPACGTGGLLSEFASRDITVNGQDLSKEFIAIAKLRFAFNETVSLHIADSLGDSVIDDLNADAVIINPPFNLRYEPSNSEKFEYGVPSVRNANYLWLQLGLSLLNENGKAVIALSNSSLSSGGKEADVRRRMLEDGIVEAIISLPSNLLDYTTIPFSIWVLNPNRTNTNGVLFIDATNLGEMTSRHLRELKTDEVSAIGDIYQEFTQSKTALLKERTDIFRIVDIQEIRSNDYNLSVSRYFVEFLDTSLTNLQELRTIVASAPRELNVEDAKIKTLSIKDLSTSVDNFEIDISTLPDNEDRTIGSLHRGGLLLLARVGEKLKPSFLPSTAEEILFNLKNIYPFAVDEAAVRIDYLIQELSKEYVQKQINSYREGTAIQTIRKADLLSIKISVPSIEEQSELVAIEKDIRFQLLAKEHGFEDEIARLKEEQRKDLGSKRHNILQHLNNVKSSANILSKMLKKHDGVLRADEVINPKTGVTVERRLKRLQESVGSVLFYVNNLTNEIDFEKLEPINLYKFVRECIEKGNQSDHFYFIDNSDKDTFIDVDPMVLISKRNFEEMYNNILYNAINHGFIDEKKKYTFRYEVSIVDNNVVLLFENNGKPFPKGIGTKEKYLVKGESAGKTGNTGMGGWLVGQFAEYFDASFEIFDAPEEEYPVGFQFKFKLTQ